MTNDKCLGPAFSNIIKKKKKKKTDLETNFLNLENRSFEYVTFSS